MNLFRLNLTKEEFVAIKLIELKNFDSLKLFLENKRATSPILEAVWNVFCK